MSSTTTPAGTRPRLLLLDGHSLAYRAFYALPPENFATTTGQTTNAVYGFTSMLINTLRDEVPTHVGVAFDVSRQSFRTEVFPEYKAQRASSPDEFKGQVELIKEVLGALNINYVALEGYEADDILATWATRAGNDGFDVLVLSGDRDTFGLVNERVTVLYPKKGVSDLARMTPAAVEEKYGLPPSRYPDFAALRGDPSDNLPSVPGVGEKTAAKWIREYDGLEGLVAHVGELTGKVGQSLRDHLDQVLINRQLTELQRDVELPLGLDDLTRQSFDRDRVHELFDSLQFRVLRERLFSTFGEEAPAESSGAADAYELELAACEPAGSIAAWLETQSGPLGVACTGTFGRGTGEIHAMALACEGGQAIWFDPAQLDPIDDVAVGQWLADPERHKVMHDAKGPWLAMLARGWELAGLVDDTALAAYLVLPGQRTFDAVDLVSRFCGVDLTSVKEADQPMLGLDLGENDSARTSLAAQARALLDLAEALDAQLVERGAEQLLRTIELPILELLVRMEATGIAVDLDHLQRLDDEFGAQAAAAASEAESMVGRPFNLGSPKQLQEILFVERNLPKTKKIKTGYTTDADALQSLFAQTEDPLLAQILRWRDVTKLRQIVAALIPLADHDSRIHTTFNQLIAATGRLSSQDPNLQNIPIRTAEGRQIRDCFVVGQGYETLLTADYSQIEMRIMAHLSADDGLIAAFNSGEDLHNTVGAAIFGVAPQDVDAEQRRRVKAMSYGLAYGLSAFGLAQQLGIANDEARALMDGYFSRFGGIRDYLTEVVAQARAKGYTETIFGRRRYLPDLNSDNRQRREMAERMALNAPIQGSAADIVKVAMLKVDSRLAHEGLASRLLLQVHDELVLEVAPGELDTVRTLVTEEMRAAADLSVPLDVSVGIGTTWEQAGH